MLSVYSRHYFVFRVFHLKHPGIPDCDGMADGLPVTKCGATSTTVTFPSVTAFVRTCGSTAEIWAWDRIVRRQEAARNHDRLRDFHLTPRVSFSRVTQALPSAFSSLGIVQLHA